MSIKLFKNVVITCLLISPITHIYGETLEEYQARHLNQLNEFRARNLEQMQQNDLRNKAIQEKNNAEYERLNRANQQKSNTTQKQQLPTQQQIDKLENLMSSDNAKNAVNYIDNLESDTYTQNQAEEVEMNGFDKNLYPQKDNGFEYKSGNGGGVNEQELFPLNLGRQN